MDQYLATARERLKIDGYMLLCIWPVLNPLSIHVTFTTIVPGAYPGRPKCVKMANFWTYGLNYWETVVDRWVHAAMRLTSIESSFHPCNWCHIHWPSFSKEKNKGSVLLQYSCFDHSILMFLMREGLQCRISISKPLKHCLMRLWNDSNQLTFVFPFAETRSIKRMWRQLTERIIARLNTRKPQQLLYYTLMTFC